MTFGTKALLTATAIIETAAGIAMLAVPASLTAILLGAPLDEPAGLVVARFAGSAMVSLGVACWFGRRDVQSRAAVGIVAGMLIYNIAAAVLLASARFWLGMSGLGLLPLAALHAALAVWCIACLTAGWSRVREMKRAFSLPVH